jgi:hypothetical protein
MKDGEQQEQEGGDPACWLGQVCPECGAFTDQATPATCPRCGGLGAPAAREGQERSDTSNSSREP